MILIKGEPNKTFYRYVLKSKLNKIPVAIKLFKTDENGEARVDEKLLYDFELKRLEKRFDVAKEKGKK